MAKIERIKKSTRGKDLKCSKCGHEIAVGETYLKATPYKRAPIIRCTTCGLKQYEISGSSYINEVGAIVEDWTNNIGVSESSAEEIISVLEGLKDQCQESLDNMPENLQYGDTGSMLQERIDSLDGAISELEQISWEDCESEARDEAEQEYGEYDLEDKSYESEDEFNAAIEERVTELTEEKYESAINDALSGLEY